MKTWMQDLKKWGWVSAFALGCAFFLTQGLPLWAEDYDTWLSQATAGWGTLVGRLFSPLTSDPRSWGMNDRPGVVLAYKILHALAGEAGGFYYMLKSAGLACVGLVLFRAMTERFKVSRWVATWCTVLFFVAPVTTATVLHLSDPSVFVFAAMGALLFWSADRIRAGGKTQFGRDSVIFFGAVYLGSRFQDDFRLVPLILLVYLLAAERTALRKFAPLYAGTLLASLPWSGLILSHLPPFVPGRASPFFTGWTYAPISFGRLWDFVGRDWFDFTTVPISLLAQVGAAPVILLLVFWGWGVVRDQANPWPGLRARLSDRNSMLLVCWLFFAALASSAVISQNRFFEVRFGFRLWVPGILLAAIAFEAAWRRLRALAPFRSVRIGWSALFILQIAIAGHFSLNYRRDLGHTMIAVDKILREVEERYPQSTFVFGPGFIPYGFHESSAPAIRRRGTLSQWSELSDTHRFQPKNTVVAAWGAVLDPSYSVALGASGCWDHRVVLFDLFFPCSPADGAVLLKWLGPVPEISQALELEKKGKVREARTLLETYLVREPLNLGALFMSSVYSYRLGDFVRMERDYDQMGGFFPTNLSVLYNWGISKMGTGRFAQAIKLLEQARLRAPGDFAVEFNLAEAHFRNGSKRKAVQIAENLLEKFPAQQGLRNTLLQWKKE